MVTKEEFKVAAGKIKEAGYTLAGWAKKHNIYPSTFYAVIGGHTGFRQIGETDKIVKALRKDKFLS